MKKRFISILLTLTVVMGLAASTAMSVNAAVRRIVGTDCPLLHDKCETPLQDLTAGWKILLKICTTL